MQSNEVMYAEASLDTNFAKSESLGLGCQFHLIEMCFLTQGVEMFYHGAASEHSCLQKKSSASFWIMKKGTFGGVTSYS